MPIGVKSRYYCVNTAGGCRYAVSDHPFGTAEFKLHQGVCMDANGGGCGRPLVPGDPLDLRSRLVVRIASGLIALTAAGWIALRTLFPAPLEGVAFASGQSQVADTAGTLAVEVVRPAAAGGALTVEYATADGTAVAGVDYSGVKGQLHFGAGETKKSINVPLVSDMSYAKGSRDFRILLSNVQGQPLHIVRIAPTQAARNESLVAEQSVRALSVVAKDVADLVVRQRMLDIAIVASRERPGEFAEYKQSLAAVSGNLTRAREAYAQGLRELQAQQANIVVEAMNRVSADLMQRKFQQQGQAVTVMLGHYRELRQNQRPDMDRWAEELSRVIPRIGPAAKRQPSA